jgi:hypothetical protein
MTDFYKGKKDNSPTGVADLPDMKSSTTVTSRTIEMDEKIKTFLEKSFTELYEDLNNLTDNELSMKQQYYTKTFIDILTKAKLDSDKKKDKSLKLQLLNVYIALVNQYALDTFLSVVSLDDSSDKSLKKGGGKIYVLRRGEMIEINERDMQAGDEPLTVSRSSAQEVTCFTLPQSQESKRENRLYKFFMDCIYPVTDAAEQLRDLRNKRLLEREKQELIKEQAATSMVVQRAAIINNQITSAEMRDDCTSGAACCFSVIAASTVPGIYAQGCGEGVFSWLSSFVYTSTTPDALTLLRQVGSGFTNINPNFLVVGLLCGVGSYCCAQRRRRMTMDPIRLSMITNEEMADRLNHRAGGANVEGALMDIATVVRRSGATDLLPGGAIINRGIKSMEKSRRKKFKPTSDKKVSMKNIIMNGAACKEGPLIELASASSSSASSSLGSSSAESIPTSTGLRQR